MAVSQLPPWNTKEARESLTKRFYNMTPPEFQSAVESGRLDHEKNTKMFKTLMMWYPDL